eukprot:Stramenopile-MAST_4_protein_6373
MAEGDDGNGGAQQLNPLETAQLTQIEVLCEKLYTTASMDERLQADKDLESLFRVDGDRLQPEASMQGGIAAMTAASDFRVIGKHEFLLSKSESNYAIHFSSSALLTIARDEWGNLNTEQRLQLRNFVYSCLAVKGKKLLRFAVNGLIT